MIEFSKCVGWPCQACHLHFCGVECYCGLMHNCPCDCRAYRQAMEAVEWAEWLEDHGI